MPARAIQSKSDPFPLEHGLLLVSAASLESRAASDAFEVMTDHRSELTAVLIDVRSGDCPRRELALAGLGIARQALHEKAPIYEIVARLRTFAACEQRTQVGIALLRFSQPEARVEILNAGMPAIPCVLPDGRVELHPALSPAIGMRFGDVHPYELSPLTWGSSWFLLSDGLTGGMSLPHDVHRWLLENDLQSRGAELSTAEIPKLRARIANSTLLSSLNSHGDATLMVISADAERRFRSGIQL